MIFDEQEYDESKIPPMAQLNLARARDLRTFLINEAAANVRREQLKLEAFADLRERCEKVIRKELEGVGAKPRVFHPQYRRRDPVDRLGI